ncbi:dihydroneopterin aldolase [Romboutsia maritimum]|uniref:7,8-dihydroneopterin aldolase n=1 Tax=Romboutsia maritimum TaxID=2020948 RepID=A0A371IVX5_9FIRM|nr:dihydroneopterin aldolase [Romboutsia maritimum]RDY24634.1 dihydroneopterin aldolase [Romboutsia maritimum]
MDKILLNNLGFYGYHGVLKEESVLGQKFFIDIELYVDTKEAGQTDDMNKSVSYAEVYDVVKDVAENKRFNLIEALAENIAAEVLEKFNLVEKIMVRIKKPEAPVNGIYDYFGVEIRREKNHE